jgi:hypothetical protein
LKPSPWCYVEDRKNCVSDSLTQGTHQNAITSHGLAVNTMERCIAEIGNFLKEEKICNKCDETEFMVV